MVSRSTVWLLCLLVAVGTTTGYVEPFVINGFQPEVEFDGLRTDKSEWSMMEPLRILADGAGNPPLEDTTTVSARTPSVVDRLKDLMLEVGAPYGGPNFASVPSIAEIMMARESAVEPVPLVSAGDMDGDQNLEEECEGQGAEPLSVETAAAAAVRAIRHACDDLRRAAVDIIKDNLGQVLVTEGWARAVRNQPEEVVQLSRLLAGHFVATNTPAATQPTTTTTTTSTTSSQLFGDVSGHDAPTPVVTCPNTPLDEDKVAAYRILPEDVKTEGLIKAAQEGQIEELRSLLAAGAFPNSRDWLTRTVLQWAAWRAQAEAASCLLDAGAGVDTTDNEGYTPLHMAAIGGNPDVVRLLAAWGADPNARDNWGWTPLHLTVREDKVEAGLALLEAGASDEIRNDIELTPLELARTEKYRNPRMEFLLAEIHGPAPFLK